MLHSHSCDRGQRRTRRNCVDLDADPKDLGYFIKWHRRQGQFVWDPRRVVLRESGPQTSSVEMLHMNGRTSAACNANLLDFLLANRSLIPGEWKERGQLNFWGTALRTSSGQEYIRYLRWNGRSWSDDLHWFGESWYYDI